ncbi:MAG: malonyl-CoA synthase [Alphaproteobacteria bacterium]|nr:malonyl-CoA synthase [Alphaproteobacteria bacterium]MBU0795985.1 malonyl-CoA synthase [Alphaproteobacteria bacterium]MBU0885673.1 malonyl-CoA synthase [Alphaproteobacteria bacterium]MBU1812671.1 malonyl-CoA synthase [Alphaproteobacteria bacterium]
MSDNLYDLFASRFPADPDDLFIETDSGARYSYADLDAWSAHFAHLLVDLGVTPGDRVAVQVDKSPEAIFLYLACLRAGAAYLPLNTAYQQAEIEYFLGDAEPRVVVCRPGTEGWIGEAAAKAKTPHVLTLGQNADGTLIEQSRTKPSRFDTIARAKDDLGAILYTSGTTGRSKGGMLTHWNLASNALTLHKAWAFRPGDVLLHALPIFHTHGLFVATNCVLLNGSAMIFLPKFDADQVVKLLPRATVMMGVPTFYVRLLGHTGFNQELVQHMRLFIAGSAPLLTETFNLFRERTGHTILERYGMTETGMLTSNPYEGDRLAGSCGRPLADVEVRIADENGVSLATGETGIIEVRGPNVFKGYWRMPEKTKAEIREDGFFITGDVGRIDEKGYVWISGRAKDLIISGGFNVYPKEVEEEIDQMPGVEESAVIGVPHPDFGEGVIAVVARKSAGDPPRAEEISARLKTRLAAYKLPKHVFIVDELPRNAMGKVQKNVLRDQHKDRFSR